MQQIVIVGAGPVGMAVAALCVEHGAEPYVVERRLQTREGSRAIGVAPASLEILGRLGLEKAMLERGVPVRAAYVHNEHRVLGRLDFSEISGRHPYILVVPQVETEELLRQHLTQQDVAVHEGWTVESLSAGAESCESVRLQLQRTEVDVVTGKPPLSSNIAELQSQYVVCADGFRGQLAAQLGLSSPPHYLPYHFVMGDFHDRSALGADAHLWFTSFGAVESFPLPAGKRRWIAQLPSDRSQELSKDGTDDVAELERFVHERTGFSLRSEDCSWRSSFQPVTRIASEAAVGRCFLAGDALHAMSPIGGQGMNSGIADAELLSELLVELVRFPADAAGSHGPHGSHGPQLSLSRARKVYAKARLRAGSSAASRAGVGTHIGSLRGRVGSGVRSTLIQAALNSPLQKHLASHFAMRTIPYRRAAHAVIRMP
ncbi:MAG: FAD-dependent oxidoreductase [Spirochaetia bacterium]